MTELDQIVKTLHQGGTILYPTDTIWGLGCDGTNAMAIKKVFDLKNRPKSKPFILLVSGIDMLHKYVQKVHPRLETLLAYHQRPLTVIYENPQHLPSIAIGPDHTVAIRIVHDPFCNELITKFGKPIVATSANRNGEPFPKTFGEISFDIMQHVDYIANHRRDDTSAQDPSVIVRLSEKSELIFLRG